MGLKVLRDLGSLWRLLQTGSLKQRKLWAFCLCLGVWAKSPQNSWTTTPPIIWLFYAATILLLLNYITKDSLKNEALTKGWLGLGLGFFLLNFHSWEWLGRLILAGAYPGAAWLLDGVHGAKNPFLGALLMILAHSSWWISPPPLPFFSGLFLLQVLLGGLLAFHPQGGQRRLGYGGLAYLGLSLSLPNFYWIWPVEILAILGGTIFFHRVTANTIYQK